MKKRFTEQQIAYALKQAGRGISVSEVVRKLGISEATFYNWKEGYSGLTLAHRHQPRLLIDAFSKKRVLLESEKGSQSPLRHRIRAIGSTRVCYGYERIDVLLGRAGWRVNHQRVYCLYQEEGLSLDLSALSAISVVHIV